MTSNMHRRASKSRQLQSPTASPPKAPEKLASQPKNPNTTAHAPIVYTSHLKTRESMLGSFNKQLIRELIQKDSKLTHKLTHSPISRDTCPDEIESIIKTSKQVLPSKWSTYSNKKVGSMYLTELWGTKHLIGVIKASGLDKAYESSRQAQQEELKEKVEKLEKLYERRRPSKTLVNSGNILKQWNTKGLNDPILKVHRKSIWDKAQGKTVDNSPDEIDTEVAQDTKSIYKRRGRAIKSLASRIESIEKEQRLSTCMALNESTAMDKTTGKARGEMTESVYSLTSLKSSPKQEIKAKEILRDIISSCSNMKNHRTLKKSGLLKDSKSVRTPSESLLQMSLYDSKIDQILHSPKLSPSMSLMNSTAKSRAFDPPQIFEQPLYKARSQLHLSTAPKGFRQRACS